MDVFRDGPAGRMYRRHLSQLRPGQVIARVIYTERGEVLLGAGCVLHDLGKMYIDEVILDKPGRLTIDEFDEIKKHPQMGLELIRRMPVFSILPAHVAFPHVRRAEDQGTCPRRSAVRVRRPRVADEFGAIPGTRLLAFS